MATRLTIVFEGTTPGLDDSALSLGLFGPALQYLPTAVRQVAKDLWRETSAPGGPRRGRVGRKGDFIDVRMTDLRFNSPATILARVELTPGLPPEVALFADQIMEDATGRLINDLAKESSGRPGHWAARKLLGLLPAGLQRHSYEAVAADGRVIAHAALGAATAAAPAQPLPYLEDVTGRVVGVISEARRHRVELRSESRLYKLEATQAQCLRALDFLRDQVDVTVRLVDVEGQGRLLFFVDEVRELAPEERLHRIHERWGPLLSRLAQ